MTPKELKTSDTSIWPNMDLSTSYAQVFSCKTHLMGFITIKTPSYSLLSLVYLQVRLHVFTIQTLIHADYLGYDSHGLSHTHYPEGYEIRLNEH